MKSKPFKFMTKHIVPVMLAVLLICFTSLCGYMKAYATDLPISGGWSGYDIIYTLLNSIGITISVQPDSDGTPPGYTAESYDSFISEIESNVNAAKDNIDTGDTPVQQLMEELKALPSTIKDGCISVSQELWEFLNSYVYQDIASSSTSSFSSYDEVSALLSSVFGVNALYGGTPIDLVVESGYSLYCIKMDPDSLYSGYYYVIALDPEWGTLTDLQYNYYGGNQAVCSLETRFISSCVLEVRISDGVILSTYDYGCSTGKWNVNIEKYGYDYVIYNNVLFPEELAPDVIWPKTDLAYDIVNHVATWDEAIAAGAVTTAEDDDTVAVIPLTDTAVGEDVYVDAGDIVIPGSSEAESEASSEATSEAESEKADELVDESVISTLPDKAAAAGDITKLFPFCIPFDIVNLVKGMQASKKAPVWTFKYYFKDIDYTFEFTVDMTDYDKYIQIFRAGIVIFYVITLMLLTIRYSSGIVKD